MERELFMLHQKLNSFISNLFRNYYKDAELDLPYDMELREFALQPVGLESYMRHLTFSNLSSLKTFVIKHPPLHIYYSSAKYVNPSEKDMESKGWLGSDLIFDIDADHICKGLKSYHYCIECRLLSESSKCPNCNKKFQVIQELSINCMNETLEHLKLLIDILSQDFGLKGKPFFSGNRGFHYHVECGEKCLKMTSLERAEMISYIRGEYLDKAPALSNWKKRSFAPEIDSQVSIDVSRLVRIPRSINGKSGMLVAKIDPEKEFSFSPELSPFYNIRIKIKSLVSFPKLSILGHEVKMKEGDEITLEGHLAVFLILKAIAIPLDVDN